MTTRLPFTVAVLALVLSIQARAQDGVIKVDPAFDQQLASWKQLRDADQQKLNALAADIAKAKAAADGSALKQQFDDGIHDYFFALPGDVKDLFAAAVKGNADPIAMATSAHDAVDEIMNINAGLDYMRVVQNEPDNLTNIATMETTTTTLLKEVAADNQVITSISNEAQNLQAKLATPAAVTAAQQTSQSAIDAATRQYARLHPPAPQPPQPIGPGPDPIICPGSPGCPQPPPVFCDPEEEDCDDSPK